MIIDGLKSDTRHQVASQFAHSQLGCLQSRKPDGPNLFCGDGFISQVSWLGSFTSAFVLYGDWPHHGDCVFLYDVFQLRDPAAPRSIRLNASYPLPVLLSGEARLLMQTLQVIMSCTFGIADSGV